MPDLDRTDGLILYFTERQSGRVTRTRLVKFLYLADYEARRWLGRPISSLAYTFDNHGPYDRTFTDRLERLRAAGLIEEESRQWFDFEGYVYHFRAGRHTHDFSREETAILEYIVEKYSRLPLPELLDEVVYQTEPMKEAVAANARMAPLNMDRVDGAAKRRLGTDLASLLRAKDQIDGGHFIELA